MIEIRTGVPGAGKTSTLISDVMAEQRRSRRPVYYCNIPDCSVPGWQEFPDPTCWKKLPRDAILVVDDAHFGFTVRQFNVLAPKHVKELSDHGRYGLDIYLVALDIRMVDELAVQLCDRHVYVERSWEGPGLLQTAVEADVADLRRLECGRQVSRPVAKDAFGFYRDPCSLV